MAAPTDTFIQTAMQQFNDPVASAGVFTLLLVACFIGIVLIGAVVHMGAQCRKARRVRWDKDLASTQRREKRPAFWGHYR